MAVFKFNGIEIQRVEETADAITFFLAPQQGALLAGVLESNFQALTGFTEDAETGLITPVFETVTLTFNGY